MPDRRVKHTCYCCNYVFFCKKGEHFFNYERCQCTLFLYKGKKYVCSDTCASRIDEAIQQDRTMYGFDILN